MKTAIEHMGKDAVLNCVKSYARQLRIPDDLGIDIVCAACCDNIELAPAKRGKKIDSDHAAILNWISKFNNGYMGRPSKKTGTPPKTLPDPAVSSIIACAIPSISQCDIEKIEFAHRLSMSAENLLGPFVEEYVFERLKQYGWALAWGETVRSVDLCSRDGRLIQIKNRSNTENSSSNKVREGTSIKKWFRVDAGSGEYLWEELCAIANVDQSLLTEQDFRSYFKSALNSNPKALGIDENNPWRQRLNVKR